MDHTRPAPSHRFFSGLAEVVQPTLAEKIGCSVRQSGPHVGRHYINEGPKLSFAGPKCLLCSFPLIDVNREAIPLNDLALGITQRFTSHMMPAILSIRATQAVYCAV